MDLTHISNIFIELTKPFYKVFTNPPQQWHPILIHFPLVFLILESFFLLLFFINKKADYAKLAFNFLTASFISILIVMVAGIHDCGLNLGPGNKFLLGLHDRLANAFHFQSSVTVHFWLAIALLMLVLCRLVWYWRRGVEVLKGGGGILYGVLVLMGLWVLLSMSYVGGSLSHQ